MQKTIRVRANSRFFDGNLADVFEELSTPIEEGEIRDLSRAAAEAALQSGLNAVIAGLELPDPKEWRQRKQETLKDWL